MYVLFICQWFGPEIIVHDQVGTISHIEISGPGDVNQVSGNHFALDNNYDKIGLVLRENVVGDSKPPMGRKTSALGLKLEHLQ